MTDNMELGWMKDHALQFSMDPTEKYIYNLTSQERAMPHVMYHKAMHPPNPKVSEYTSGTGWS